MGRARRIIRNFLYPVAIVVAVGLGYAFWPRQAHLRRFEPKAVAHCETSLWRAYYEKKYVALSLGLYSLGRDQYGFSPWDSTQLAWYASQAAKVFQPTLSRADAQQALPLLERYFRIIRQHAAEQFDVEAAARRELEWWQLRRENATPATYGQAIAEVTGVVFAVTNADVKESALLRADAMAYRDEHGKTRMEPQDWDHIEQLLTRSYDLLKSGLNEPAQPASSSVAP